MVKELVMDNLYNTNALPSKMKGGDKFAYVTGNDFQNIFSDKNSINYTESFNQKDLFNASKDSVKLDKESLINNSNDFQSAGKRLDNKVSSNISTPRSPKEDTPPIPVEDSVNSDGYSFSIRDSLQEKDNLSEERLMSNDAQIEDVEIDNEALVDVEATEKVESTEVVEEVEESIQVEDAVEAIDEEVDVVAGEIVDVDETTSAISDNLLSDIGDLTDIDVSVNETAEESTEESTEESAEETKDELTDEAIELNKDSDKNISNNNFNQAQGVTVLNINNFVGAENIVNNEDKVNNTLIDSEEVIVDDIIVNSKTEELSEDISDNSVMEKTQIEGKGYSEEVNISSNTEKEDNLNIEADTNSESMNLEDGNWEVLDESEQYEIDIDIPSKAETVNNDKISESASDLEPNTENKATEEVIVDDIIPEDVSNSDELLVEEDVFNQKNIDSTDVVKTDNKVKETNSQSKVQSNSVEIADDVSQSLDEIENKDQIVESIEKAEESKTTEANTETAEVVEIVEDEILDTDVETKADDKTSDVMNAVNEESEVEIEFVVDDQSTNSDSKKENYSDKENQETLKSTDKLDSDVDINLDERRKLAYVDMTTTQDTDADVIGVLESKISMYGEKEEVASEETIQNITDILDYSDVDTESVTEKIIKPTSMDELVDEEMLDELNITLKNSTSGIKESYSSTSTTAEQLIRYAIEGENNFDARLSATLRPTVQTQGEVSNSSSKEILAQITEKLTSFNFKSGSKLTIQLSPESMGTVEIKLTHTPEGIKAEMSAVSDDARDMLNKNLDDLRDTLQKYGVRLDKVGTTNIATQQSMAHQDYTEQGNSQKQQQGQRQQNEKTAKETERFEDMVSSLTEEEKE